MNRLLFLICFLIVKTGYSQVANFDILSKEVKSSKIKTITKFHESNKFPSGEKKFKCEFDTTGRLLAIEEYEYPMGPENPIIMRQDYKYDSKGKNIAINIKAPGGSTAIDSLIYDDQGKLVKKIRFQNGQVVQTKEYSTKENQNFKKRKFDENGNLIKEIESDSNYVQYKYDSQNNLIEEIEFQNNNEYIKYDYHYNENRQLIKMETYLLYISNDTKPLKDYFEYETYH